MTTRNTGLDIIRVVALLLVILQHCWSVGGMADMNGFLHSALYKPFFVGVPLFVMLSGSLQLSHVMPQDRYLSKRFSRLLIPFAIWATVVFTIQAFRGKIDGAGGMMDSLRQFIPCMLEGRVNAAYWYVYMMLGLYMITPVLHRAFDPNDPRTPRLLSYCLWLWAGVQVFKEVYPQMLPISYYSFEADIFLGYYLMGYYIIRYLSFTDRRRYGLCGTVLFLVINMLYYHYGEASSVLGIAQSVCMFMLLSTLDVRSDSTRVIVEDISRYSYTIYLTHMVAVGYFCQVVASDTSFYKPVLLTVAVILIEYAFCRILSRQRFVPAWVLGL